MSYTGKVKNGVVVLPPGVPLVEGQQIEILPGSVASEPDRLHEAAEAHAVGNGLPNDLAANHDYYLHGGSKQQPRRGRWIPKSHPTPELKAQEAADYTDQLLRFAAETRNLPPDLAANHEHYLHGLRKQ